MEPEGAALAVGQQDLIVATFNIGGHCQDLKVLGTEWRTVKRMVEASPPAPPWGDLAAEFMAKHGVHLLGVQEMLEKKGEHFARVMTRAGNQATKQRCEYDVYQPGCQGAPMNRDEDRAQSIRKVSGCKTPIYYRKDVLGNVVHLTNLHGQVPPIRSAAAIYVQKFQLVFINLWLGHTCVLHGHNPIEAIQSLEESLNAALGEGSTSRPVDRVIVTMDANDETKLMVHDDDTSKKFMLLGKTLWQKGKAQYSCSEGNDFRHVGDYIFDSAETETADNHVYIPSLSHPRTGQHWLSFTQLMSDHLPVAAMTTVNVFYDEEENEGTVAIANMVRDAIEENTVEALEAAIQMGADSGIDADLLEMGHASLMAVKSATMLPKPSARAYVPPMMRRKDIGDEGAGDAEKMIACAGDDGAGAGDEDAGDEGAGDDGAGDEDAGDNGAGAGAGSGACD